MLIDLEDIEELRKIHFQETGEQLSDSEAGDMGKRLLRLYRLFAITLSGGSSQDLPNSNDPNDNRNDSNANCPKPTS